MTVTEGQVAVISGGVGAAKFLRGLIEVHPSSHISAVVNVADDMTLHGLQISPDIDTVTYTLADAIDPERGWGLRNETWNAMEALGQYGERAWFSLGDKDLATHLERTAQLAEGSTLTAVTASIAQRWGVGVSILPVSDDRISTKVTLAESGKEVSFQEYFVGLGHDVALSSVRFDNIENARPTQEALNAIANAQTVIIAPSNPIVSIAPVLSVPGVTNALRTRTGTTVAISPIVGGRALKGPAANMLVELGHRPDAVGVAELWADLIDVLVIDDQDAHLASAIRELGVVPFITNTIMATPAKRSGLATAALSAAALGSVLT